MNITRVSVDSAGNQGNGISPAAPSISADGRFVVFNSTSTNLVPGDTNASGDVFVRDLSSNTTTRVSWELIQFLISLTVKIPFN